MSTREFYRQFAHEFEHIPFEEILLPLLKKYIPNMKGAHILDVGAGTGALGKWLQEQGSEVLCLDPSEEMISRCLQKGLCSQLIGLEAFSSDEPFDAILAISSLIHLPKANWSKELHHLAALLKSKGILFLSAILGDFEGFLDPTSKGVERFFSFLPEKDIEHLLEGEFQVLERRKIWVEKMNVDFLLLVVKKNV